MDPQGRFTAELVSAAARSLAAGAALRLGDERPEAFADTRAELEGRLAYLAEALAAGHPELFLDHLEWLRSAFQARKVPLAPLVASLAALREELQERLPPDAARPALDLLSEAAELLAAPPPPAPDPVPAPDADLLGRYLVAVLEGRGEAAIELVLAAADAGRPVGELHRFLGAAQAEIGAMWQRGEIHVAEEHYASRVAEELVGELRRRLVAAPRNGRRALVTSVGGELHDLGARIVSDRLWAAGWDTLFLGANTPAPDVVRATGDFDAHLLGISMSVALHVRATADLVSAVKQVRPTLPVIVGGRPFVAVPGLWRALGADASATSAEDAVDVARRFLATRA